MRRFVTAVVASVVTALLAPVSPWVQPASAAPASPTITAPTSGATLTDNPVLKWSAPTGAVKYDVQVSANSTFSGTPAYSVTTANLNATPPTDLALGTYWWRVRAIDTANAAGPYAGSTFSKVSRKAPVTVVPTDGAQLVYPKDPLFFQWKPMAGARSYEIQIDDDALFVGAPAPVSTPNTRYAPLTPPVFGNDFWWRVRAKSNGSVYSEWSTPSRYSMSWGTTPVTLLSPPSTNTQTIEQVGLTWAATPGAAYYEVQVSPDSNFNNPIVKGSDNTRGRKVVGTHFGDADSTTSDVLNLPAGSYFWRVRAMSTSTTAEPGPWSDIWTFTRAWPGDSPEGYARPNGMSGAANPDAQVQLLAPADADYTLTQPQFRWTPQRGASNYEVQFSSDAYFSPTNVGSCFSDHTSLTPFWRVQPDIQTSCQPRTASQVPIVVPGKIVYWRVRALDRPSAAGLNGQWSAQRSFLYDQPNSSGGVTQLSPADGAAVAVPVLQWKAVDNIAQYKVILTGVGTYCNSVTAYTYNTTYVPETLNPACTGYWKWTVQGVEDNNNTFLTDGFPTRLPLGAWSFSWTPAQATATTPEPVTSTPIAPRVPPLMTWTPVAGADRYQVYISPAGAYSWTLVTSSQGTTATAFAFTGVTSRPGLLSPGDYDFFVQPLSGSTSLTTSDVHQFHIAPLPAPVMTGPEDCPLSSCTAVEYTTPTFTWQPVEGAGLYILYLATDPNFTHITREFRTVHTTLTPAESLPDSQAGQATYWFVRACYDSSDCGPFDASVFPQAHAFRKVSVPVQTLSPAPGATVSIGEVTFSWNDYLLANVDKGVTQEAAYYRVQVSNTQNFTNPLETSPPVDQTQYTADLKTYPDGPLYWRVQAYDNTGNPLTYSPPVSFTKKLLPPTTLAPSGNQLDSSAPLLTWDPMPYSGQYEVEIYTNPGTALSPGNRVASIITRSTSAIPTTTLAPGAYGWRVRRIDANGLPGSWSAEVNSSLALFTVGAPKPVLAAPASGSVQSSRSLLFSWGAVPGATRYRVEASTSSSFGTLLTSETTDQTAWAPNLLTPAWPNSVIYWRVHALDPSGAIMATSSTGQFTRDASTAGEFTAVAPFRVLDTRPGSPLQAGSPRTVTLTGGSTGIPSAGVSAVVLNATVTGATLSSSLTLYPAGTTKPNVWSLTFAKGQTVANHVTVPVDSMGRITMANYAGDVDVLLDVVGYYSNGALARGTRYSAATTPTRIVDTRGGSGIPHTPLASGESRVMQVSGLGGVPSNATAVVLNVTAVNLTHAGFLSVYPTGTTRSSASSVSFPAGKSVPNLVTMRLGSYGRVNIYNYVGPTDVLLDVVGWYLPGDPAPGARLRTLTPARIADTRQSAYGPKLADGATRSFQVRGVGGVPNSTAVTKAILTVTVTQPVGSGFATVFPSGTTRPGLSNLTYSTGQTVSSQVIAKVGSDGKVNVYTYRSAHVVIDVVGWLG